MLAGTDIPAHHVVNAKGELSGAGYFETWDLQKLLLWEEGVETVWNGTVWSVDLKKYGWKNTLKEAEELAALFNGASI